MAKEVAGFIKLQIKGELTKVLLAATVSTKLNFTIRSMAPIGTTSDTH
jgi:hypothetical protein